MLDACMYVYIYIERHRYVYVHVSFASGASVEHSFDCACELRHGGLGGRVGQEDASCEPCEVKTSTGSEPGEVGKPCEVETSR